jgi:arylsulfatase A-like enzyme
MRPSLVTILVLMAPVLSACTGADGEPSGVELRRPSSVAPPACRGSGVLAVRTRRGYFPGRSPDVLVVPNEPDFIGPPTNPPHTGPWGFLVDVPLVVYGPGFAARSGSLSTAAEMVDVAPTTASLVGYDAWPHRDGRVLRESLITTRDRPRLVVTLVWDGAGWNSLRAHPEAWPYLRRMMARGTTYSSFSIGSSPSVTPPVHATLGTGVYPNRHGIIGVSQRVAGQRLVDPWRGYDPRWLRVATLADMYDRARGNAPVTGVVGRVNWHLGMIGRGASFPGGDRDPALLLDHAGRPHGNEDLYAVPPIADVERLDAYTRSVDVRDGERDRRWRGQSLDDPAVLGLSPAFTRYQGAMLRRTIDELRYGADEIPDLLYVNFKQADLAYHRWGMRSPEVRDSLAEQDRELRRLVSFLDSTVGPRRWVLVLTADHGMMPSPDDSGGYPIKGQELLDDVNARFDRTGNGVDLVYHATAYGVYVRPGELRSNGVDLERIAAWMGGYTLRENVESSASLAGRYRGRGRERLFRIVLVGRERVDPCARRGS